MTIFNGFRFGFNFFYSERFGNYEVIDNILKSKRKTQQKKLDEIKFDKSSPLLIINDPKDTEIEGVEEETIDKKEEKDENETDKTNEIKENEMRFLNIISFILLLISFILNTVKKIKSKRI